MKPSDALPEPVPPSAADMFDQRLRELSQRYARALPAKLAELKSAVAVIATAATAAERGDAIASAAHIAHRLTGASATFGLPAVSAAAAPVEQLLLEISLAGDPLPALLSDLKARVEALAAAAEGPHPPG